MPRLGSPLRDSRSAFLLVGLLAGVVYLSALPNEFAYDDIYIVATNTAIQSMETLPGALVQPYWPGLYGQEVGLWRPVTTALFGLEYVVSGGAPLFFHAVNVLAHVAASMVVLALFLELLSLPAALAGALVFAVHPVHVEAVANIVGLSEILSTMALVLACLVHIRGGPRSGWRSAVAVGALYAVGFGAKESGVTLPGLILLIDAARSRITLGGIRQYVADRWRTYLVMLLVAVGMLAGRFLILDSVAAPFAPLGADLLTEIPRIWTLGDIWMHYVRLWVFPLDLASDYSPNLLPISTGWRASNAVGAGLALVILTTALVAWRRRDLARGIDTPKTAAFGVVWFLIAISPISNTVFLAGALLAERTFYLPSVGLAAATGWLVVRLARDRKKLAWGGLVVALALSSVRTWTRNPTWHDNEAVFDALLRDYPQSGRSQWVLGDRFLAAGLVSDGRRSYRLAIDLLGTSYQLVTEISKSLMGVPDYRTAEGLLTLAVKDNPEFPLAYSLLAVIRAEYGDAQGTEYWARGSLERFEPDAARHHLLAWALAAQGRFDEAAAFRARGEELSRAVFWQAFMYSAYVHRAAGDRDAALAAVDTAWAQVMTEMGRVALDSVRVTEFGLETKRIALRNEGPAEEEDEDPTR